jgi:LIM-domain binding protein
MNISLDGARERIISPGHAVVECVSAVWTYKYSNGYTIHLRGPLTAHVWVVQGSQQQSAQPAPASGQPVLVLRFEHLQFDANYHDKYITIDAILGQKIGKSPHVRNAPTPVMNGISSQQVQQPDGKDDRIHYERSSLPGEPVNAFGVPQATMRCLEVSF